MKLSLAMQTPEVPVPVPVALLTGSLEDKLAKARDLGADGVELLTVNPKALDASALRVALDERGLEVAAIGSGAMAFAAGLTLLHSDLQVAHKAQERLRDLIDLAADLGAPLVTIGSLRGRVASVGADGRALLAVRLRQAADYAAARGVRLALEPLNRYETDIVHTATEGLAFVEEVGHPALGLLLDTYHVNIEEQSWTEPFRNLMAAGRLWHVHLGDNNRLPPGRGLIDFAAIVATLGEAGYRGYLSAELLARPDPDTAAAETMRAMRRLVASYRGH
mgnify:CR=1 FL=1